MFDLHCIASLAGMYVFTVLNVLSVFNKHGTRERLF